MRLTCKLNKSILFYTIMFIGIIPFDASKILPGFLANLMVYSIRFMVVLYSFILLKNKKNIDNDKFRLIKYTTVYFFIIAIVNLLATITNQLDFNFLVFLERIASMICVYATLIVVIFNKDHIKNILSGLKNATLCLVVLSILLFLFFPEVGQYYAGNGEYMFLGVASNRNGYIEFALLLIISVFSLTPDKLSVFDLLTIVVTLLTVVLTGSVTSIIITMIIMLIIIVNRIFNFNININVIFKGIMFIWIMFFAMILINTDFSFISGYFNRTSTLSGRTIIWEKTVDYISNRPLLGYGYDNEMLKNTISNEFYRYFQTNDSHNAVLYIMLSSGWVGLVSTVIFIFKFLNKKTLENRCNYTFYLKLYIIAFLIRGLTESCLHYSHVLFYIVLILINYNMFMEDGVKLNGKQN